MGGGSGICLTSLLLAISIPTLSAQEAIIEITARQAIQKNILIPVRQELLSEKNNVYEPNTDSYLKNNKSSSYIVTPEELAQLNKKRITYSGKKKFDVYIDDVLKIGDNYNTFITRKGVSPIKRLANKLTSDTNSLEANIQNILNFVTNEVTSVDYSPIYPDSIGGYPDSLITINYVLKNRQGNCAANTILCASLFEQNKKPIDYYVIYLEGHLAIAVHGNFPTDKGLYFNIEGKKYFYAETTVKNFKIGVTELTHPYEFQDILQLQKPGNNSRPYDLKLHKKVNWYNTQKNQKKFMKWRNKDYERK